MKDGVEVSKLIIYDAPGEINTEKSSAPSSRRLLGEGDSSSGDDSDHKFSFDFDYNVKKFEEIPFTLNDSIAELGGSACIIFIVMYFFWWLISLKTAYSFFNNLVEMVGRKYNEASEWK